MFQSNDADDKMIMQRYYGCDAEEKVAMKCYYGCCNYEGRRQIQVQQLQCHQGCHKQYIVLPPYPTYMVINQHYSPTSSDFGVSQTSRGIPTMPVNRDHNNTCTTTAKYSRLESCWGDDGKGDRCVMIINELCHVCCDITCAVTFHEH